MFKIFSSNYRYSFLTYELIDNTRTLSGSSTSIVKYLVHSHLTGNSRTKQTVSLLLETNDISCEKYCSSKKLARIATICVNSDGYHRERNTAKPNLEEEKCYDPTEI